MKYKFLALCAILVLLTSLMAAAPAKPATTDYSPMPANPEKILQLLIKQGVVSSTATAEQKEAAVYAYLQNKMKGGTDDAGYNPLAHKNVDANEEALNLSASSNIRGRKLGNTTNVPESKPAFKELTGSDKLLLILVEFGDQPYTWTDDSGASRTETGPAHNQISVPDNSFDLYIPDFNTQHYEDMLFTPGGWSMPADAPRYANEHRGSMRDYYLEQSYGQYTIDGKAYGWFKVAKPEAYYGDDSGTGHDNNLPGTTKNLLSDAVDVINSQQAINWLEYDQLDLYDLDGDGDINEPDCIIDHPLFIHAGIDQSGGGGAQGDDAIWAHSSSTSKYVTNQKNPGATCPTTWPGTRIYNYTIMPEDGGVGVFAHEFGHDLGLPDEYDTAYTGRGDNVAFWSLMSSGSWVGQPAQTQPSNMSIWARYTLGWLNDNLAVTDLDHLSSKTTAPVRLEQSVLWGGPGTYNALRVNLPDKQFFLNTPHSGSWEWYGGKADEMDSTLVRTVDLTGKTSATLSFWTWYDIEPNWDFGFVQVSTDGGATWASLPITGTTNVIDPSGMPEIADNLPGFTGNSGGWVYKTFDMKDYVGKSIELQFRYMTDWGTTMAGFFVDDIAVTADGATVFTDDVETADAAWTSDGWERTQGTGYKPHYYMMEWRNLNKFETTYNGVSLVNFDNGLKTAYQFDTYAANPNEPWYFSYNPGLLLWYRDLSYTDNWTGAHPGGGFLLVVDAHPQAMLRPPYLNNGSLPWNNRVQTYDSTFSLNKAFDIVLSAFGVERKYSGQNAVPGFDDVKSYWDQKAPDNSVMTPTYGLLFRVLGQAQDGSAAVIGLGLK